MLSARIKELSCRGGAILRPLRVADIGERYLKGINSDRVQRYLETRRQLSHSDLEDFVRSNNSSSDSVLLGLFIDGEHAGNVRLHDYDGEHIWLGIAIFDESRWGRGWGTAALKAATSCAVEKLGCQSIHAGIVIDNEASRRLFDRCGYVRTECNASGIVVTYQAATPAKNVRRLAIGTANFGMDYGIVGNGRLPQDEVDRIVVRCAKSGIVCFDTAIGYGGAEQTLGRAIAASGRSAFEVTTKIPPVQGEADVAALRANIAAAKERVGVERFDAVLLHRATDLLGPHGAALFAALSALKGHGDAERIGISVYAEDPIEEIVERFAVDVVQLPYSIADQRLRRRGVLDALRKKGIEISARSILLQGVLAADTDELGPFFSPVMSSLAALSATAEAAHVSRLAACIGFVMAEPLIDRVVVGVDSMAQLDEVVNACDIELDTGRFASCEWSDERLLNPSNWPIRETV